LLTLKAQPHVFFKTASYGFGHGGATGMAQNGRKVSPLD